MVTPGAAGPHERKEEEKIKGAKGEHDKEVGTPLRTGKFIPSREKCEPDRNARRARRPVPRNGIQSVCVQCDVRFVFK
uniref:Uncharacterized protein n=1 Tax=Anopheles atroparvus TaxID=41427 RepID=A0AAG5DWW1_ANOAO